MNDNAGTIALSKNPVHHERSKHIGLRHHFLRERVEDNTISLSHVPSADNIADLLTKGLLINAIASFDVIVFLVVLLDRESSHSCVACPPPCPFSLYGSRNICRAERLSEPENLLDCNVSHHRSECV
jgi:hypothetical protein